MISPQPMTYPQDGGYLPRHDPRMDEEDDEDRELILWMVYTLQNKLRIGVTI